MITDFLAKRTLKRISTRRKGGQVSYDGQSLQDIVNRCAMYQSQLNREQNDLMKIFTIITSVFLPLTPITGWHGNEF